MPGHGQGNVATAARGPVIKPDPYTVSLAPDAEAIFDEIDAEVTARQREAGGGRHSAVLARVWESTAKVAPVKAVSANPEQPVIRARDAS